jgi:glycosyltransferase involved in cell wall biosynthesis
MVQSTNTASAGIFKRFFSSVPLVLSIQGLSKTTGNPFVNIFAKSYDFTAGRMLIKTSNKVIVLAKALVERALQLGAAKEKITICPPSVDIERFNPDKNQNTNLRTYFGIEKSFVIGFVGRFVPLKGIFDLIKASRMVAKKYPIHLLFVGDGPLREKVVKVTHSLKIPFTVTGWVSNPEAYYSVMDVFVLPSYSEGFPRTCLEAMAMKKPIIATDVGANKELIKDGKNGFIIPPKKPKILAQKILEFIENNSLIEEWGRTNRKLVEKNYTLMHEVKRLEKIYEEVLGDSD